MDVGAWTFSGAIGFAALAETSRGFRNGRACARCNHLAMRHKIIEAAYVVTVNIQS
jgi:hypothetical protein